jgi:hypothetical protein
MDIWRQKILAYLHDPAFKPWYLPGHVKRAAEIASAALGEEISEKDLEQDRRPDYIASAAERLSCLQVTKAMNECHKHGFKHGLFSGEAVWVGPPDSDGRRGVKLDGFEWYSLPDPIFRKAVAVDRKEDLAPEVSEAMGEESQSTSLYDGKLPESADIYSLARFVEICLDEADREKTDWRKIDSDKNLANWLQQAAERKKESRPADLQELVGLLDELKKCAASSEEEALIRSVVSTS